MKRVLFYVSGHGYGHATRAGEVIRALADRRPDWAVYVVTSVEQRFFPEHPAVRLRRPTDQVDAGVVETDTLTVDPEATLDRVESLYRRRDRLLTAELSFARGVGADLLVADAPPLAGYVAEAAGVPCLGLGNFTWDWIYEPFSAGDPRWVPLMAWVRGGYTRMRALLRLPFGHPVGTIREVVDVPLVARRSGLNREEVRRQLGANRLDSRPLVLVGLRGFTSPGWLDAVARDGPDYVFLSPAATGARAENIRHVSPDAGLQFPDLLVGCDALVGKLGYGLLAEAITASTAILYPPRTGFREDELLRAGAAEFARSRALPPDDFRAGRWAVHLRELLANPPPPRTLGSDGAEVCAAEIIRRAQH